MDKSTVLNICLQFGKAIEKQKIQINKLVLYGSFAYGTPHEWSDIDLVVVSDDFIGKGYWERIDILSEAICEVFQPIEAVAMTIEEWESGHTSIARFARNGQVVYAA